MLSGTFRAAVEAELAIAEAHVRRLHAFLAETGENGSGPHETAPDATRRKRVGRPVVSVGPLGNLSLRAAIQALLPQYAGGLATGELADELKKRGVKVGGRTKLGQRVSFEIAKMKKTGIKIVTRDKKHYLDPPMPPPVKNDTVHVLS